MESQSLCILVQQRIRYSSCVFIYFTCTHPKTRCAAGWCLVADFCILSRILHREVFWAMHMVSRHCNNINDKLCHNLHLAESLLLKERAFTSVTHIGRSAVSFCPVKPAYEDISNIRFYLCFLTYLYCQAQKGKR